jgi:hypothetical protein
MTAASTSVAVVAQASSLSLEREASSLCPQRQARCLSYYSWTKWMPCVLCIGLLIGQTALCPAQTAVDSSLVPHRADRPENPPPAGPVPKSYGPVEAGQDAYRWAEQERREAISRQLQTKDAVAYGHAPAGYYAPGPPVRAVQVSTGRRGYRYAYRPPYVYPRSTPPGWLESWPFVASDIHGYPYLYRTPHPFGHEAVVIGPRSSLVRPVYPTSPQLPPPSSSTPPPPPAPSMDLPQPAIPKPFPPTSHGPERILTPPPIETAPIPPPPPAPGAGGAREF